jgi:hypothetical protein
VGKEMELGLLGHPLRKPHRVDQLDGTVCERDRVGDPLTTLVSVPTEVDHDGHDRRAAVPSASRG